MKVPGSHELLCEEQICKNTICVKYIDKGHFDIIRKN